MKKYRVAIICHNDIISDTRVRKGAGTLVSAGHQVEIYGIKRNFRKYPLDFPAQIEGGALLNLLSLDSYLKYLGESTVRLHFKRRLFIGLLCSWVILTLSYFSLLIAVAFTLALTSTFILHCCSDSFKVFTSKLYTRITVIARSRYRYDKWAKISNALASAVLSGSYDSVHAHDLIGLMALRKIKSEKPSIFTVWDAHEIYTGVNGITPEFSREVREIIQRDSKFVDSFITISKSFASYYEENFKKLPPPFIVMNATRARVSSEVSIGRLRESAGISKQQKVLLYQGGFSYGRGLEILIASARSFPNDWSLVCMGSGPLEGMITEAACSSNIIAGRSEPLISVLPPAPLEELRHWTSEASLGIIPYEDNCLNHRYCTPNKLWEFPSAGVPIVANDLVEIGEMIRKYDIGILLQRDFGSDDILAALKSVTVADIERWKSNCLKFSEIECWEAFEPSLLSAHGLRKVS